MKIIRTVADAREIATRLGEKIDGRGLIPAIPKRQDGCDAANARLSTNGMAVPHSGRNPDPYFACTSVRAAVDPVSAPKRE